MMSMRRAETDSTAPTRPDLLQLSTIAEELLSVKPVGAHAAIRIVCNGG